MTDLLFYIEDSLVNISAERYNDFLRISKELIELDYLNDLDSDNQISDQESNDLPF